MSRASRRILTYLLGAFGVMVLFAFVYQWGMWAFQGADVAYLHALYVVVETFTTTGFGVDAGRWTSAGMLVMMVVFQLTGVGLIFLALPAVVIPLVGEALSSSPPTGIDQTDHVVICSFTPRGETPVRELDARDQP